MANLATTCYKIQVQDEKVAQDIYNTLQQLDEKKGWNIRLCDLAEHYGIDYEKEHISVRGSIYYFDIDNDNMVLTIETESAWTGCHELFDAINEKLGDCLQVNYRCIECGCEIFEVRDSGDFFPEECIVSASGEPFDDCMEDPYDSVYDAIEFWLGKMKIDRDGRTDKELLDLIESYEYESEDTYFYIHEIEFV